MLTYQEWRENLTQYTGYALHEMYRYYCHSYRLVHGVK